MQIIVARIVLYTETIQYKRELEILWYCPFKEEVFIRGPPFGRKVVHPGVQVCTYSAVLYMYCNLQVRYSEFAHFGNQRIIGTSFIYTPRYIENQNVLLTVL